MYKYVTVQEDTVSGNDNNYTPVHTGNYLKKTESDIELEKKVVFKSYRLPYMTLPKKTLDIIFYGLYIMIVIIALLQMEWFVNSVSVFGATCVPLSLYVIPGYYYGEFHRGYNRKKYIVGRIFAVFGVLIMIVYTALVFFSQANFLASQM